MRQCLKIYCFTYLQYSFKKQAIFSHNLVFQSEIKITSIKLIDCDLVTTNCSCKSAEGTVENTIYNESK